MPDSFRTLLPGEYTEQREFAIEQASGERWVELDVDIIRRSKDPWLCPEHLLPFLASDFSVDIWHDGMSITDKRYAIARSIEMHRIKGTREGLRQYVELAGGELTSVRVPPEGLYLDQGPTQDQRDQWLSRFAQVRLRRTAPLIYDDEENYLGGLGDDGCFLGGDGDDGIFLALYEPEPSYEAVLWDNGIETQLTKRVVVQSRGTSTAVTESYFMDSVDADAFLGEMCFDDDGEAETFLDEPTPAIHFIHRVEAGTEFPVFTLVGVDERGDFQFVHVEPDTVREITIEDEFFLDDSCIDEHFAPNTAHRAMYQRWRIYDAARSGNIDVVEGCFLDDPDLFGLPPYHALVDVKALDKFGVDAAFLDDLILDDAWLDEPTLELRERILDATISAKSLRDKYLISTRRHRPVKWSDRLPWGFRWDMLRQD